MNILETIQQKLSAALKPEELKVADDSAPHYGHDGATPGQVSHIAIRVVSAAFAGKSRVERSRMVFAAVADEVRQVHAVTALQTFTPEEWAARKATL